MRLTRSFGRILLIASLGVWSSAALALPQGPPGAIAGDATDQSGAVLKGALVSLETKDIQVATNEQGRFLIRTLEA